MDRPDLSWPPDFAELLLLLIGFAAQIYLGRQLRLPRWANYGLAALMALFCLCQKVLDRVLPFGWGRYWLPGLILLWFVSITGAAFILLLKDLISNKFGPVDAKRRQFLRMSTAALCVAPATVLGAGIITRKEFRVNEIDVHFPNLPKDLQGVRLVQLSDIHMGAFFSARDLSRVVDATNELRGDLILITGDLITTRHDPLDTCLTELSRLRADSGVWGCMGNHEMYAKAQRYTQIKARELGMNFLRYESAPLKFGDSRLNLIGVDFENYGPYLEGIDPLISRDSFNLLLAHTPEVFPDSAHKGIEMTISGHTHGGQINLELLGKNFNFVELRTPYTKGLYRIKNSQIYVNSGLGTIGVPVRLGAPAEISVLRLCNS